MDTPDLTRFLIDHRDLVVAGPQERGATLMTSFLQVWRSLPLALKILLVFAVVIAPAVLVFMGINVVEGPPEIVRFSLGLPALCVLLALFLWVKCGLISPLVVLDTAVTGNVDA